MNWVNLASQGFVVLENIVECLKIGVFGSFGAKRDRYHANLGLPIGLSGGRLTSYCTGAVRKEGVVHSVAASMSHAAIYGAKEAWTRIRTSFGVIA